MFAQTFLGFQGGILALTRGNQEIFNTSARNFLIKSRHEPHSALRMRNLDSQLSSGWARTKRFQVGEQQKKVDREEKNSPIIVSRCELLRLSCVIDQSKSVSLNLARFE